MQTTPFRWAILGPGNIAHTFAQALSAWPDAKLEAVASRSLDRAQAFAGQYGAPRAYGSYAELAASSEFDAVYIATPHPQHCEAALLCMEHGHPVLVEKPMVINAAQARRLADCACANGVFLMEAMWTRFLPAMAQARRWIAEGRIGEPRLLTADFSFRAGSDPHSRLLDPALGGGALLDVGIYVMELATMIFGAQPVAAHGEAFIGPTGVDEQTAITLRYGSGALAVLTCAVRTQGHQTAVLCGTEGRIEFGQFWKAQSLRLVCGDAVEELKFPLMVNGFEYQIREVMDCIAADRIESPLLTHQESCAVQEMMDDMRGHWGLRYPME